jgi:hypothetical protein
MVLGTCAAAPAPFDAHLPEPLLRRDSLLLSDTPLFPLPCQVVSLHGLNPGVRNTVMTSYGERLLLFSTKDSAKVPASTLVHQSKMHFVAHQGSTITALQTSQGIEGSSNLISGAMDGKIHMWVLPWGRRK